MPLYLKDKMVSGISLGVPGKSAYEQAKEGGYTGTEEEFAQILANAATTDYVDEAIAGGKEIFKARYGTTTSAEVEAAYQSGKFCICVSANGKVVYTLYERKVANQHYFVNEAAGVIACKADIWSDEGTVAKLIGSPTVAEMNAAIAAIPTPDVSGQINEHNASATAHAGVLAPMYTYGTEDLTAGSSPLATGQLHFVYE